MERKWTIKKTIIAIIITNIITASCLIFLPMPLIGGKAVVSKEDYNFIKQFRKMSDIKAVVEGNYYEEIDQNKMLDGAIKGMVNSIGDPYTTYLNKKEFDDLKVTTSGAFTGIGISIDEKDGKIIVVAPIEDSPAEKAGIKAGDFIIKVDDKDVTGKEMDNAVNLMRGKAGTSVKVTVLREGSGELNYNIKRAKIVLKTVKGQIINNNIGYIRITTFDENTASNFVKKLDELKAQNIKGLILDLRDNPGGLLDECKVIADKLVGEGTIVYTLDKFGNKEELKSKPDKLDIPLVVLVNGGSASASEIVTGAVRDYKAGTIIGTKTFGKGLVQTIIPLTDGTGVKVTIARYYTPSGECIQGKGITPNIVLDLPEKDKMRALPLNEDIQVQEAIKVINSK